MQKDKKHDRIYQMEFITGSGSSEPEAHTHIYKQRISVEEAEKAAREKDGLLPGITLPCGNLDSIPDIFDIPEVVRRLVPERALLNCYNLSVSEHLDIDLSLWDYGQNLVDDCGDYVDINEGLSFSNYVDKFYEIEKFGYVITDIQSAQSKEDDSSARQENIEVMRKFIDEFKAIYPQAELDISQPRSMVGVGKFLEYYKKRVHEDIYSADLHELIEDNRQLLVDGLDSSAMKRQLGADNAKRIAQHFKNQPLIIVDPLTALLEMPTGNDWYGWFKPEQRACYINTAAIANETGYESTLFKARVLKTMAHEFLHAATSNVYRAYKKELGYIEEPDSKQIWSQFFYEGMVEKAAYMLALNAKSEWFSRGMQQQREASYERSMRKYCSDNPGELMATRAVVEARNRIDSSYPEYRLLIDTIMDKADWQAAGLSRRQSESLAIGAFFDRTDDKSTLDSSARQEFMQAVHKATHKGFFNKIGGLSGYMV